MNDIEADLLIANAKIKQLEQQLSESQHSERAAVEDLKKHRKYKCDCCYYADKQGRYIPCRDCQSPISNYGDGWQWRGPQEAGEGDSNG
jgi:cytidine deaminase